jgi:hypothetical protein
MNTNRLRAWLFPRSASSCPRSTGTSTGRRFRPAVEALEDRLVMSTFSVSGTTLIVTGTLGIDSFSFAPMGTKYLVKMNGASRTVDPTKIHMIVVDCKGPSADYASLTVGQGPNSVVLEPGGCDLTGANYEVILKNTGIIRIHGGNGDTAFLNSGTTSASLIASATDTMLFGKWYSFDVTGFGKVTVTNHGAASNAATFHGAVGSNVWQAFPSVSAMVMQPVGGPAVTINAVNFAHVDAYVPRGSGTATLFGLFSGENLFEASSTISELSASDRSYSLTAHGFQFVDAVSNNPASDIANLRDDVGGATFVGHPGYGLFGWAETAVQADGFHVTTAVAVAGAGDSAQLYADPNNTTTLQALVGVVNLMSAAGEVSVVVDNSNVPENDFSQVTATTTGWFTDQAEVNNGSTFDSVAIKASLLPYKLTLNGNWGGQHSTWDV